jgi:dipeptidyl aminopeptidase/acylaminoacyl peptidase
MEPYLSKMEFFVFESVDGLKIPSYLSLPKTGQKPYPTIALIHGGPKGPRDEWGYNGLVQFLTNRGYAVFQPNFRSSGGFGKSFLNAGDKEWGKKMQDDITFGVQYLIDSRISDKDRIGIMGGSYGGYATLSGLAFTPDLYACGIDIVGPSNLFTLLETIPPYWEAGRKWLYEMVGDPQTKAGQKLLKESSPLFSAGKIKKPLLIVQGANDPRVKISESEQIVDALKKQQKPVYYLCAEDEGHGFRKPLNNLALYAAVEKFLSIYLGGRAQLDMEESVKSTLEKLTVFES